MDGFPWTFEDILDEFPITIEMSQRKFEMRALFILFYQIDSEQCWTRGVTKLVQINIFIFIQ